ncbi:MAG: nuclear transport factor 2 family protein [Actinomycetes bacterium]
MHPNAELIRSGYDAFAVGDLDAVAALFADDITWTHTGDHVLAGEYHGKQEVFEYFGKLLGLTNGTFRQTVHAILADDDHVVVLTDVAWDEPREFRSHDVFVWHVRDGKATACWAVAADQAASHASLMPTV